VQKHLAILYIAMSRDSDAQIAINKLKTDFSSHLNLPFALNGIARSYKRHNKIEDAIDIYRTIVMDHPNSHYVFVAHNELVSLGAHNELVSLGTETDSAARTFNITVIICRTGRTIVIYRRIIPQYAVNQHQIIVLTTKDTKFTKFILTIFYYFFVFFVVFVVTFFFAKLVLSGVVGAGFQKPISLSLPVQEFLLTRKKALLLRYNHFHLLLCHADPKNLHFLK